MILSLFSIFLIAVSDFSGSVAYIKKHTVYAGVFFNISTPEINFNKTMSWFQASNSFTYGFALPRMTGNKILLTGKHDTHYQLSIISPKLWSDTLANKCNPLFESAKLAIIKVIKTNVSILSVNERIELLFVITKSAGLVDPRNVVMMSMDNILLSKIMTFRQNHQRDSYYFLWIECFRFDRIDKSIEKLKGIAAKVKKIVGNIGWFWLPVPVSFTCHGKKIRHKRSTDQDVNYHIVNHLPTLKINVMEIMNYNIPMTVFQFFSYPYDIHVFQMINNTRQMLKPDTDSWIIFTPSTRNIRFQPTVNTRGVNILQICTNRNLKNESCAVLQVIVTSVSPQIHQIHIREDRNNYIINYTLPLVWFRSHKVMKDSQIQITGVKASTPVVWGNFNNLLFLNLSSIEGTVLELSVDVVVNNKTFVKLELMMPLMSLSTRKSIIYQFRTFIQWLFYPFKTPKILLYQFKHVLQNMASEISQLFDNDERTVIATILPLQIHDDPFTSIYIENENLTFDWTFSLNYDLPNFCLMDLDLLVKSFKKMPMKSFIFINTTIKNDNKMKSGCGFRNSKKITTSNSMSSEISTKPYNVITTRSAIHTDIHSKQILIPNLRLSVECGIVFQHTLPTAISEMEKLRILPVRFTGPQPDWITYFNDNRKISGVIAKSRCPKKEFHFRIVGSSFVHRKFTEMDLIVDVMKSSNPKEHKFQIDLVLKNVEQFHVSLLIKTTKYLTEYIRSACLQELKCQFNLTLLRSSIKDDGSIIMSYGYEEDSTICPQNLGIFLQNLIIDKSSQNPESANILLAGLFYQYGLGQITHANLLLNGVCQNERIFPPNLGQIIVYNNIPSFVSLRPFVEFYNRSVTFAIDNSPKDQMQQEIFSKWIKLSNDSFTLLILAWIEQVSKKPYILQLLVHPKVKDRMLLPTLFIEVRNLMLHKAFHPFIRELNHQISVDITTTKDLTEAEISLSMALELTETIDKYLRFGCASVLMNDCGADILIFVNSIINIKDGFSVNYKLSSLRVLMDGGTSRFPEVKNQKVVCPLKSLNQMESKLRKAFIEYRQMPVDNRSWTLEFIKVLHMGSCVHSEMLFVNVKGNEEIPPKKVNIQKERKVYFENTQQMFLMATVIPACSFIFITLILGLITACLLNRRKRKRQLFNSVTLKVQKGPPVAFQPEFNTYSPPSKPLILQNEKPPQSPPEDENEDNEILIPNIHSINFLR